MRERMTKYYVYILLLKFFFFEKRIVQRNDLFLKGGGVTMSDHYATHLKRQHLTVSVMIAPARSSVLRIANKLDRAFMNSIQIHFLGTYVIVRNKKCRGKIQFRFYFKYLKRQNKS